MYSNLIWSEKLLFGTRYFLELFLISIKDTWILSILGLKESVCFHMECNIQGSGKKIFIGNKPYVLK